MCITDTQAKGQGHQQQIFELINFLGLLFFFLRSLPAELVHGSSTLATKHPTLSHGLAHLHLAHGHMQDPTTRNGSFAEFSAGNGSSPVTSHPGKSMVDGWLQPLFPLLGSFLAVVCTEKLLLLYQQMEFINILIKRIV